MLSLEFLKAGRAVFTVDNGQGKHYTFKVNDMEVKFGRMFFVSLLTAPETYTYMGKMTDKGVVTTAKSKYGVESIPFRVFNFAYRIITGKQELPDGYSINHSGACGRCGRELTTPESIKIGLGPHCASKV